MPKLTMLSLLLATFLVPHTTRADETPAPKPVLVERVFFPIHGYDNNDNIMIVIEGSLPDPCYVIDKSSFSLDPSTKRITVQQLAWRRSDGVCGTGDDLGEGAFSQELSLGRLQAGKYEVVFHPTSGQTATRDLYVGVAKTAAIDNFNYPHVSSLNVNDYVFSGTQLTFTISGFLAKTCDTIQDPVKVAVEGDVIVVLPIENPGVNCAPVPPDMGVPGIWQKTITLPALDSGEYLIHVRSANGRVVERTFNYFKMN